MNDFEVLQKKMAKFVTDRDWEKFHSPKNLAMSIAIESSELMEIFQWMDNLDAREKSLKDEQIRDKIKDELADVMIYCLSFANVSDIDLKQAIEDKMEKNNDRFPIGRGLN